MNNVIETLHEATTLTNADLFSVLVMGVITGGILSDGFRALVEFIVKRIRRNSNDKTCNKS